MGVTDTIDEVDVLVVEVLLAEVLVDDVCDVDEDPVALAFCL